MRGFLAGVEEFASGFSVGPRVSASPASNFLLGEGDVRIELAPCFVRPWCWLACCWVCSCGACCRDRGIAPARWGCRHCGSFPLWLWVVGFGEGGGGRGFGIRCQCRRSSVSSGGRCNWRREMLGGPLVGDGSLSWNDRSRDAPAQGVGARAAGAAGLADNDKDLARQGPGVGAMAIIMGGSIPFVFKTSDKPKKSVYS